LTEGSAWCEAVLLSGVFACFDSTFVLGEPTDAELSFNNSGSPNMRKNLITTSRAFKIEGIQTVTFVELEDQTFSEILVLDPQLVVNIFGQAS